MRPAWGEVVRHSELALAVVAICLGPLVACVAPPTRGPGGGTLRGSDAMYEQVLRGRQLVIQSGCGDCHGGRANPAAEGWLAGNSDDYLAGPLASPFSAHPRNLTPDPETGLGRFTERQIFNALRYGLRPSATPDVEITSAVPGQGNHPVTPRYLSPAMPWLHWRSMTDQDLWDIAAYLKRGLKPVRQRVPDSEGPPDFWASTFTVESIGTHILPPFPTMHEELRDPAKREHVLHGRNLVAAHACGACHGGGNPAAEGWLAGLRGEGQEVDPACNYCEEFQIGPFRIRPRNLTPDNTTGLGRFSERQIFNALRYGLRPGETPDMEITSSTPGQGSHPVNPKYLAPPMPWTVWRHLSDEELWAIAAYLKHGLKPVSNKVEDSEGPPDFWLSEFTEENYGSYPAPPFPTANEVAQE